MTLVKYLIAASTLSLLSGKGNAASCSSLGYSKSKCDGTAPFCEDSTELLYSNTSSVCDNILNTGILECYGLLAFHRTAVNPWLYQRHHHRDFPQDCFWGDDFWLAYYAFRMNISMYVMKSQVVNPAAVLVSLKVRIHHLSSWKTFKVRSLSLSHQ